jgi:hypothetical protein
MAIFAQAWTKVTTFQSVANYFTQIQSDSEENYYCAGYAFDSLQLSEDICLRSKGNTDCFIFKTDSSLKPVLMHNFGGPEIDQINDMVLRQNGNMLVTGTFQQGMTIGDSLLNAPGSQSFFIAELSKDSTPVWACVNNAFAGYSLAVIGNGDVVVAGQQFDTAVILPGDSLFGHGMLDIFLARYDNTGKVKWAINVGSKTDDYSPIVSVSGDNQIYFSSTFFNTIYFNGNDDTLVGEQSAEQSYIAKYDAQGNFLWTRHIAAGDGRVMVTALTNDSLGNLYVVGWYSGSMRIDTTKTSSNDESALFIAKLTPDGTPQWIRSVDHAVGNDIKPGNKNELIITGSFKVKTTFDTMVFKAQEVEDFFVAGYSLSGDCKWVLTGSTCQGSTINVMGVNATSILMAGSVDRTLVHKPCQINLTGLVDTFENGSDGRTFISILNPTATKIVKPFIRRTPQYGMQKDLPTRYFDFSGRDITSSVSVSRNGMPHLRTGASRIIIREMPGYRSRVVLFK